MPKESPKESLKAIRRKEKRKKPVEEALTDIKTKKVDLKPMLAVVIMLIMVASTFFYVIDYLFPAKNQTGTGRTLVAKYGPYDVYSEIANDYYIYLTPAVEWHFRANPVDALKVPVFPDKEALKKSISTASEVWVTYSPNEDPRIVVSAMELAKTAGALNKTVKEGFIHQPERCKTDPNNTVCSKPVIPMEFSSTGYRAVFRMLGPRDNATGPAIFVFGNTTVLESDTYEGMDLAADKVSLILLGLA